MIVFLSRGGGADLQSALGKLVKHVERQRLHAHSSSREDRRHNPVDDNSVVRSDHVPHLRQGLAHTRHRLHTATLSATTAFCGNSPACRPCLCLSTGSSSQPVTRSRAPRTGAASRNLPVCSGRSRRRPILRGRSYGGLLPYLNSGRSAVGDIDLIPSTDFLCRHKLSIRAIPTAARLSLDGHHVGGRKLHHVLGDVDLDRGRHVLVVVHEDDLGGDGLAISRGSKHPVTDLKISHLQGPLALDVHLHHSAVRAIARILRRCLRAGSLAHSFCIPGVRAMTCVPRRIGVL